MLIVSHLIFDRLDRGFIVQVDQLVPNDSTDRHIQALFFDLRGVSRTVYSLHEPELTRLTAARSSQEKKTITLVTSRVLPSWLCVCCCISVGSLVSFLASTCMGMAVALQPLRGTKGFCDNSPPPTLIEFTRPNKGSGLRAYLHLSSEFHPFGDRTDAASGCANLNLADSVTTSGS